MVGLGELGSVLDRVGLQVWRVLENRLEPLQIFLEEHRFATRVQRGAPCWLGEALSYPLLLSSVTGMMVSLAALASGLMVIDHSDRKITWALMFNFFSFITLLRLRLQELSLSLSFVITNDRFRV